MPSKLSCTPEKEREIEEYVVEAYGQGYYDETGIFEYVKKHVKGWNESDVKSIISDFFEFVRDEICSP